MHDLEIVDREGQREQRLQGFGCCEFVSFCSFCIFSTAARQTGDLPAKSFLWPEIRTRFLLLGGEKMC